MASYELAGSVSDQEKNFIETWENIAPGVNYIIRENRRGDEAYEEVKGSNRRFKLSTYDRMLTEDKVVDQAHNPFKNGSFRPVIVPDDVTIESNPNAMSDEEIKKLFKASDLAWDEYLDVIDSPGTIQRMLDMADDGEADISHKRFQQLSSMHNRYSNVGKRLTSSKDPDIQNQIDSMGGSGVEPVTSGRQGMARGRGKTAS